MPNSSNLLFKVPDWGIWPILYNKKAVIAFSGGKDSLALLDYMFVYRDYAGWNITACHVNHQLRGEESEADLIFCKEWCLKNNINFTVQTVDVCGSEYTRQRGMEYAARELRYAALESVLHKTGADYIITAHTFDDQTESFFVDICTGASVYTLGGIKPVAGNLCRPILHVTTEMVNSYLAHRGITPVFDSSNLSKNYVRNKVRADILPVVLSAYPEVALHIQRIQNESAALYKWMDSKTSQMVHYCENGVAIDRAALVNAGDIVVSFVLGKHISAVCRGGKVHIEAVLAQLQKNEPSRINLPQSNVCETGKKYIRIFPADNINYFEYIKKPGETKSVIKGRKFLFDGICAEKQLTVRRRRNGDRIGSILLKKIFYNAGIELYDRDRALIFEMDGKIVWVEFLEKYQTDSIKINN